jgi:putative DNA-invertase from lambdoid prophage Rac
MRVAIYLRVSTVQQNTDLQRSEIEKYIEARGWAGHLVFEDRLSGTTGNRPAFKEMLKLARRRRIDLVICWKLDRMYRSLKDLIITLQELQDLGVGFISIRDSIDLTTASGRLMTHMLASFAEFEASLIRERVMAGLKNAKAKGVILGRPPKLNEIEVLRLRSDGLSLGKIARLLNVSKTAVHKSLAKSGKKVAGITEEIEREARVKKPED